MSNASTSAAYYTPSLRVPSWALPVTLACAVSSLPGAWVYAWLNSFVPSHRFLLMHMVATMGYVCWLALLAWAAATIAKVRNPKWMGCLGALVGAFGWYTQWTAHVALSDPDAGGVIDRIVLSSQVAAHPIRLFQLAYESQEWTIAKHPVLGYLRVAAWLVELMLMVIAPVLLGAGRAAKPYCERSNAWAKSTTLPQLFGCSEAPDATINGLESNPDAIFSLLTGSLDHEAPYHWKVTLYYCLAGDIYVTIRRFDNKKAKSVDLKDVPRFLVENLKLAGNDIEAVQRRFGEAAEHIPTPSELVQSVTALQEERYLDALNLATPHVSSNRYSLRVDARRMCALANAKLERWSGASEAYIALFADEPTGRNALEIATSSVMAGEIESGEEWMAKALELNRDDHTVPGVGVLTGYMTALSQTGHLKFAMPYLEQLKQCYEGLNSTDSTFLWMRGVPFFETFLDKSAVIIRATLDPARGRKWYESMLPHVDQAGKEMLNEMLRSWPEEATDMQP